MTHIVSSLSKNNARRHKLCFSHISVFRISATVMTMLTKTSFTLLYLISNMSPMACLLCTNCTDILLSFNNPTDFPSRCEGKFVEANVCQVIFRANYLTNEIHLNLSGTSDPTRNYYLNLLVEDKFDDPKMKDVNTTYTCKTAADCAKLFYQVTVRTFIRNKPILDEIRSELYDPTKLDVQQCSNNQDQPVTCDKGYGCHGFEIIEDGKLDFEGECRNASTSTIFPRLYFRITLVQGDPPLASDWNHLGFTCNKQNFCNTREQIKQMVGLANDFYPWELIAVNSTTTATTTIRNGGYQNQEVTVYMIHAILFLHCFVIIF